MKANPKSWLQLVERLNPEIETGMSPAEGCLKERKSLDGGDLEECNKI